MRFLLSIVVLVLSVLAFAQAGSHMCNGQKDCSSDQYCTSPSGGNGYCVDCLIDNDCGLNEYCSTNIYDSSKYGTCQKFEKDGDSCINLQSDQIEDINVNNDTKCAVTYYNFNTDSLNIDFLGQCVNGKCRICNYASQSGLQGDGNGKGQPRVCVFPGKYATPHSSQWKSGAYYEDPIRVWLAIFFCFIVIHLAISIFGLMRK